MNKDKYWLAFSSVEKLSANFVVKLFEYFNDIENAWTVSPTEIVKVESLTKRQIDYFLHNRNKVNPDECYEFITKRGINYITYDSEDYPDLLKEIYNPPIVLFVKGDLSECNLKKTLAVVGSRKASSSAKDSLSKIIAEFANSDICIVSGLAEGIDGVAHSSALNYGLKTIAVVGHGFDYCYPSTNKHLYKEIEKNGGAIITEYWPTFPPVAWRFPQRNRIVSGLSYGTLVVEAALKSGALITANLTLEQGRELMCMPGALNNPNTEGIYKLLKDGASMATCAQDILDVLGWQFIVEKKVSTAEFNLSPLEQKIYDFVSVESKSFDDIILKLGVDFSELTSVLTMMELKGIIKQTQQGGYIKV